jgi:hypothetical protein
MFHNVDGRLNALAGPRRRAPGVGASLHHTFDAYTRLEAVVRGRQIAIAPTPGFNASALLQLVKSMGARMPKYPTYSGAVRTGHGAAPISCRPSRCFLKDPAADRLPLETIGNVACDEKTTGEFAAAVTDLRRKAGTSRKEEYERLNRAANENRMKSEHARLAVEAHIADHNC